MKEPWIFFIFIALFISGCKQKEISSPISSPPKQMADAQACTMPGVRLSSIPPLVSPPPVAGSQRLVANIDTQLALQGGNYPATQVSFAADDHSDRIEWRLCSLKQADLCYPYANHRWASSMHFTETLPILLTGPVRLIARACVDTSLDKKACGPEKIHTFFIKDRPSAPTAETAHKLLFAQLQAYAQLQHLAQEVIASAQAFLDATKGEWQSASKFPQELRQLAENLSRLGPSKLTFMLSQEFLKILEGYHVAEVGLGLSAASTTCDKAANKASMSKDKEVDISSIFFPKSDAPSASPFAPALDPQPAAPAAAPAAKPRTPENKGQAQEDYNNTVHTPAGSSQDSAKKDRSKRDEGLNAGQITLLSFGLLAGIGTVAKTFELNVDYFKIRRLDWEIRQELKSLGRVTEDEFRNTADIKARLDKISEKYKKLQSMSPDVFAQKFDNPLDPENGKPILEGFNNVDENIKTLKEATSASDLISKISQHADSFKATSRGLSIFQPILYAGLASMLIWASSLDLTESKINKAIRDFESSLALLADEIKQVLSEIADSQKQLEAL